MKLALSFDAELIGPWVAERTGGKWTKGRGSAIGKIKDGELVAGILYEDSNGTNIMGHIAGEGQWLDKTLLWIMFDYPFRQLGVNRITASVNSDNVKSIAFLERIGFIMEARLHGATSKGDILLFRMFKSECKYLESRYGKTAIGTTSA
tara:strand:+ start:7868 stop:8314 length:447 start_codon:yes stop_codon:yes gene_type:complete